MPLRIARYVVVGLLLAAFAPDISGQTVPIQKAQLLFQQAQKLEREKRYEQAAEAMAEVIQAFPKNDTFLAYAAKLESLAGKHTESIEHALQAAKANPKNPAHLAQVMRSAAEGQDFDLAKEYADKVVALGVKKIGKASVDEAKSILESLYGRRGQKLYLEAVALHLEQKYDKALAKVKQAVELDAKNERLAVYQTDLEKLATQDVLDQHALKAGEEAEKSLESLAKYLIEPAKTNRDKARLIYRWVSDRIAYNAEDFLSGKIGDNSALAVLKSRKAVCEGYANIYLALCKAADVEAVKVVGYAKGVSYKPGEPVASNHAWNAVKLDEKWYVLDSTWGAGNLNNGKFDKRFDDHYFLTQPDYLVFSHFPTDPKWQLLEPAVTAKEFQSWPKVDKALMKFGIRAEELRKQLADRPAKGLVTAFDHPGPRVLVEKAPLEKLLKPGEYAFRVEAPGFGDLALISGNKFHYLKKKGSVFEGSVPAQPGRLLLSGKPLNSTKKTYSGILEYQVE